MKPIRLWLALFAILLPACVASGPGTAATLGPRVWIDAPLDGSNLPLAPIEVVSHAGDLGPVAQVELSVNGAVVRSDPNPDSTKALLTMRQLWSPPAPGNYTLQVRAQNGAGVWSEYARAVVTIGGTFTGGIVQGMVYSDLNGDDDTGDPDEGVLDGVVVALSGCADKTMTTAGGAFKFTDLPAGTCLVQVSKAGWKFSNTYPPGIGYPAKAASDPNLPTAFSIFMTSNATPTKVPPAGPLPAAGIAFFADQTTLIIGQCTTLHWQAANVSQVFLDNGAVPNNGSKPVCPTLNTTFSLRVVTLDQQTVRRTVNITVRPGVTVPVAPPPVVATPTPVPPPVRLPVVPPTFTPTPTRTIIPIVPRPPIRFPTNTPTKTLIPAPK